jgi:hypothetical protein
MPETTIKNLAERATLGYTVDTLLVKDPRQEVEDSLKSRDYFRAAAYLSAVREKVAVERLLSIPGSKS